jgi:hypothetical protein
MSFQKSSQLAMATKTGKGISISFQSPLPPLLLLPPGKEGSTSAPAEAKL